MQRQRGDREKRLSTRDMEKIRLFERLIRDSMILWLDGRSVYSKYDDTVNLVKGYPLYFQKYIRSILKERTDYGLPFKMTKKELDEFNNKIEKIK
jgi:hypothetical protein